MTDRERDLAEAVLGLAVVVAVAVDSLDGYQQHDFASRLQEAVERWADENPEFRPSSVEIVRHVVHEAVVRDRS